MERNEMCINDDRGTGQWVFYFIQEEDQGYTDTQIRYSLDHGGQAIVCGPCASWPSSNPVLYSIVPGWPHLDTFSDEETCPIGLTAQPSHNLFKMSKRLTN